MKTDDELRQSLDATAARAGLAPGARFRHYRGHEVEVLAVALWESDLEPCVAYRETASGLCFVRTVAEFTSTVRAGGCACVRRFLPLAG